MAKPWEKYAAPGGAGTQSGPWTKYQPGPAPEPDAPGPSTGAGQAALEQFGNQATLGYLPQLQAMAGKLMPDPSGGVDARMRAQGFNIQQPSSNYLQERDANMRRLALEDEEHPIASGAGKVGGFVATALAPLGAAAKGATLAAKAYKGAKVGAAIGALANPGDTLGEVDPIQLDDRLKNSLAGAVVGGTLPVVARGVEAGASKLGSYLENKAALKASRALGRPTPTQATRMAETGQDIRLGRELLDADAVPVLGTPERIAARVDALKEKVGNRISSLIDQAGDKKAIDAESLGIQILDSPELAAMRRTPGMEGTVSAIEKQVETLAKNGTMTLKEAQALRQGIDKSINFNKAAPDMRGAQEGLYQQRTSIRDAMNSALNDLSPSGEKDALLSANRRYSNLSTASDILERETGRNQANRAVSLTDTIAGAAGLAQGGPVGAAALAAANKFGRTFGNSIQARAYDAAAKRLPSVAGAARSLGNLPMVGPTIAQATMRANQNAPISDNETQRLMQSGSKVDRSPALRGEAKWAADGADRLGLSQSDSEALMQSPKARKLLIQASDLRSGSKAMQNIQIQIRDLLKGAK